MRVYLGCDFVVGVDVFFFDGDEEALGDREYAFLCLH
jgi:hypothetical protein